MLHFRVLNTVKFANIMFLLPDRLVTCTPRSFAVSGPTACLEHFAIDPACIDHYARTVSKWTKDNTVSFGLWDMIRRFRDCLGR